MSYAQDPVVFLGGGAVYYELCPGPCVDPKGGRQFLMSYAQDPTRTLNHLNDTPPATGVPR